MGDDMPRIDIHTHFQCLDFVQHLLGPNAFPPAVFDGIGAAVENSPRESIPTQQVLHEIETLKMCVNIDPWHVVTHTCGA